MPVLNEGNEEGDSLDHGVFRLMELAEHGAESVALMAEDQGSQESWWFSVCCFLQHGMETGNANSNTPVHDSQWRRKLRWKRLPGLWKIMHLHTGGAGGLQLGPEVASRVPQANAVCPSQCCCGEVTRLSGARASWQEVMSLEAWP